MRNHSKQRYIYSWISHDAFIQRAQGQEFVEVLSLWQNTSEIAMYFNCIHVSNCNVSKLFSISYSKKLLLFIMPFTGLISITSLITYLPKHNFGIISSYFRNCRWPYSKHHICIIGRKKPMHTVNWGYIENMFFTACTFYLTMKKNYEQWTNFYSCFSGQNWLVSLENLPAPWTHLKGHVHKHDTTVAWEYPNCLLRICTAQCIALGEQRWMQCYRSAMLGHTCCLQLQHCLVQSQLFELFQGWSWDLSHRAGCVSLNIKPNIRDFFWLSPKGVGMMESYFPPPSYYCL